MRGSLLSLGLCAITLAGTLVIWTGHSEQVETRMMEEHVIARKWVEIQEDSKDGKIVFRPADYPIRPARKPRRQLELSELGDVRTLQGGSDDRLEPKSEGKWEQEGRTLRLNIQEWEGEYEIEDLQDTILVLKKR